jgi:cathepsin B
MKTNGITTEVCYPYTSGGTRKSGSCKENCDDGSKPVLYTAGTVRTTNKDRIIKQQIQKFGPIECSFKVFRDFLYYNHGTYEHIDGSDKNPLGGHAIKLIGWGTKNNTDFWIAANSWTPRWGDGGYFNIKMGNVGIDDQ